MSTSTISKALFLVILLFLTTCEKASETLVAIPKVNIDCSSSISNVCSTINSGKLVRIIMTRSGCTNPYFDSVATGSTNLSCGASGCTAVINQWTDANQNSVSEILTGSMDLCGLIDLNSNLTEDSGEMEHSSSVNISSSTSILIDDWNQI